MCVVGNVQFICRWLLFKCERSQLELLGPLAGLEPAWLNYRIPPPAAASCARVPGACPCSPWPPLRAAFAASNAIAQCGTDDILSLVTWPIFATSPNGNAVRATNTGSVERTYEFTQVASEAPFNFFVRNSYNSTVTLQPSTPGITRSQPRCLTPLTQPPPRSRTVDASSTRQVVRPAVPSLVRSAARSRSRSNRTRSSSSPQTATILPGAMRRRPSP